MPDDSSPARPLVSVVIVTWNGRHLLERYLPSLLGCSYAPLQVIVADNASEDGTAAWLTQHHPEVTLVRHEENLGFCRGNNLALAHAEGEYVVLLNNDAEVTTGWLEPLVAWMEAHPGCGAVQPKLLQHHHRTRFEYSGAAGGYLDALGYPFTRGRVFFTMEEDAGQYDAPRPVFWASGTALLLRRSALDRVGLLDERFFMHMEEIDLCWRLHRAGYSVWCVPQSVVHHVGGASLPHGDVRKTYYNFRNNLLMLYKLLPPSQWLRMFPRRAVLDGAAMMRSLGRGAWREALAIARAYLDAHRQRGQFDAERSRVPTPGFPPYRRSIVLDYFAHGLTRFSELPANEFHPAFRELKDASPLPEQREPDAA